MSYVFRQLILVFIRCSLQYGMCSSSTRSLGLNDRNVIIDRTSVIFCINPTTRMPPDRAPERITTITFKHPAFISFLQKGTGAQLSGLSSQRYPKYSIGMDQLAATATNMQKLQTLAIQHPQPRVFLHHGRAHPFSTHLSTPTSSIPEPQGVKLRVTFPLQRRRPRRKGRLGMCQSTHST